MLLQYLVIALDQPAQSIFHYYGIALSPDGHTLAVASSIEHQLTLANLRTRASRVLETSSAKVTMAQLCSSPMFSPDGKFVTTVNGLDGTKDKMPPYATKYSKHGTTLYALDWPMGRIRK